MTPFQKAWGFLKADSNKSKVQELINRLMSGDTLSTDELTHLMEWDGHIGPTGQQKDEETVREFVNRQPQKPNFGIPMQTEQTRLPTLSSSNKPYRLGSNSYQVDQEVSRNNNIRRFKDQQAAAKLHLQNNPPRLERDEDGIFYTMMSGNKDLGNVGIDDTGSIGYGEVLPAYQRQGLYGKTLQAIINERNVLHSTGNRNQNSQPFHEQFNPPYTGKHVTGYLGGRHLPNNNDGDIYTYRSLLPISIPKNWGALEYDTGALPIYQQKPAEERNAISPRVGSKQINLEEYVPGYHDYW